MKNNKYFFSKLHKVIFNPLLILIKLKLSRLLPDKVYLSINFQRYIGRPLDLVNPKSFNDKLQWLKINDRNQKYISLVDKYEVRKYIKETIGEEYLVPLIGVYNEVNEIKFDKLPDKFVLKCTHDSGNVIICHDRCAMNIKEVKKKLRKAQNKNFFYSGREWQYKNIKPRIICEELLFDDLQYDLIDYKVLCFNGEPKCLFICLDRRSPSGLKIDFYDLDWNILPFERHYPKSGRKIEKPKCFEEMLRLSRALSKDIPFVRVDFYIVNGKIKFGEMTFYPGSGFEEFTPEEYDYLLGSWIDLSLVNLGKYNKVD